MWHRTQSTPSRDREALTHTRILRSLDILVFCNQHWVAHFTQEHFPLISAPNWSCVCITRRVTQNLKFALKMWTSRAGVVVRWSLCTVTLLLADAVKSHLSPTDVISEMFSLAGPSIYFRRGIFSCTQLRFQMEKKVSVIFGPLWLKWSSLILNFSPPNGQSCFAGLSHFCQLERARWLTRAGTRGASHCFTY